MSQEWKSILHEYVQCRNQLEVNMNVESLLPLITDDDYFKLQGNRLDRLYERYSERLDKPKGCTSRAKFSQIQSLEHKAVVDLELNLTIEYASQPQEERVDKERIIFQNNGGRWRISQILTKDAENLALKHPQDAHSVNKSTPYLNQQYFAHTNSNSRAIPYNRQKVQLYADTWWNRENPAYIPFAVDCTSFVSQCLFAGGAPMNYTGRRETGWWYQGRSYDQELWSFSWAVAHSLQNYLSYNLAGLRADVVEEPEQLDIGDVIVYDWNGDSKYQHSVIVSAKDTFGMPLVNAHTTNSKHRYWDYRDSYAWGDRTQYRFFHIVDAL